MASKLVLKRKGEIPNHSLKIPTKISKKEDRMEDLTKKQVIERFKCLQMKYDALVKEKEIIEKKIKNIEKESNEHHKQNKEACNKNTIQTQTESEDNDIEFACKVCIFEADCVDELRWHLQSVHGIGDYEYNFACKICRKPFDIKSDLMYHVKKEHRRSMAHCKYFQNDQCNFTDEKCWFVHEKETETLKKYKCGICGNVFETKNNFMTHRKTEHTHQVKQCINHINNKCVFDKKCWYIHSDETNDSFSEY